MQSEEGYRISITKGHILFNRYVVVPTTNRTNRTPPMPKPGPADLLKSRMVAAFLSILY